MSERDLLARTAALAADYLETLDTRPVRPERDYRGMLASLDEPVSERGSDPAVVLEELVEVAEPGIMAIGSGRWHGFVTVVAHAQRTGAWAHVDGAFGLWAAASPSLAHLVDGHAGADSWATDAHKWLGNVTPMGEGWRSRRRRGTAMRLRARRGASGGSNRRHRTAPDRQRRRTPSAYLRCAACRSERLPYNRALAWRAPLDAKRASRSSPSRPSRRARPRPRRCAATIPTWRRSSGPRSESSTRAGMN